MMTPQEAIAALDDALVKVGQDVVLRHYTSPSGSPRPKTDLPMRAFIRPGRPDGLVGDIDEKFWTVVISPTDFAAIWPIIKGDKVLIEGAERNVEDPGPLRMQGILVRCNLLVAG